MALPMPRPWKHDKTGVYYLRRRVPADLVKQVGKAVVKISLGTKEPAEARARHFAENAALEERWANLRKGQQALSNRQVQALAGEIYNRKVAEHADNPGTPEEWRRRTSADQSLQGLRKRTAGKPSALRLATGWSEAEAVVRSRHGAEVDKFIANKGLIVTEADRRRIILAAAEATGLANESLLRNAEGDYTPDRKAERFPEPFSAAGPLKLDVLWAEYRRSLEPSEATIKRWYPILTKFMAFAGTEDIRRVTTADVIRWREKMLDETMGLSPLTVRDVYLAAPKALFGFAVSQSKIGSNPAAGVVVRVKKKKKLRKLGFSAEEADLILSASLAPQNSLASRELKDARRWVPVMAWLKDQTGRAGSLRDIGPYLLEWKADRTYAPAMERGGVPAAVSTRLGKATADLWSAARAEADLAFKRDRERYETTLSDERVLRAETLAMADGLMERVEILTAATTDLRARVSDLEAELVATQGHLQAVRADHFWDRVVNDMYAVLPEVGPMRVREIADRLGADLAEEARSHAEEWSIRTLRKKIEQRIFHKRLFARCGRGLYRRRRPEDDLPNGAGRTAVT